MSFRYWFRLWFRSVGRLFGYKRKVSKKRYKSCFQRKKEYERGVLYRRESQKRTYRRKRKYAKRRRPYAIQQMHLISDLFSFIIASACLILLPFGMLHWGYKSAEARKKQKNASAKKRERPSAPPKKSADSERRQTKKEKRPAPKEQGSSVSTISSASAISFDSATPIADHQAEEALSLSVLYEQPKAPPKRPIKRKEPDENTPKSVPKHPSDSYIRRRMVIAGSSYCDQRALSQLTVGTYLDLKAEPDNPYDKNAVMLCFKGEKVGYIPKKDNLPFVSALKLGRKTYAVITDVDRAGEQAKYEFESWFDNQTV